MHTDDLNGWYRLHRRPATAAAQARALLDGDWALDPETGQWPSGRAPSEEWLALAHTDPDPAWRAAG